MPDNFGTRNTSDLTTRSSAESVVERVYLAVKILCTGGGDARSRVRTAMNCLVFLSESQFPTQLQADFKWIVSQATKFSPDSPNYRQEGRIDATMRRIKNSTAKQIAERIFKLYSDVQDIRGFPLLEYRNAGE